MLEHALEKAKLLASNVIPGHPTAQDLATILTHLENKGWDASLKETDDKFAITLHLERWKIVYAAIQRFCIGKKYNFEPRPVFKSEEFENKVQAVCASNEMHFIPAKVNVYSLDKKIIAERSKFFCSCVEP